MNSSEYLSSEIFQSLFSDEELYLVEENGTQHLEIADSIKEEVNIIPSNKIQAAEITSAIKATSVPLLLVVESLSESNKVFLEKVLNAVNLSLNDVDVITLEMLHINTFKQISVGKSYEKVISFGVPFVKLNMQIMLLPYENKQIENVWFMIAEKLVVVENDIAHKRRLWASLQAMFKPA